RGGPIEAVGAGRFDVRFGQANVPQKAVGQVTEPALYVAAGPPLTDKGQQAFERRVKKSARQAPCGLAYCRLRHVTPSHGEPPLIGNANGDHVTAEGEKAPGQLRKRSASDCELASDLRKA
ncbi:hypothetical protein NKJ25_31530, partial [Mesorhizobium sp. M0167]